MRNLIDNGSLTASVLNPRTKERHHVRVTRESLLIYYKKQFGHSLLDALNHGYKN